MATLPSEERERIAALLRDGRKIEAIKVYRELTGSGLAEAKAAVESADFAPSTFTVAASTSIGALGIGDPVVMEEVASLVRAGKKIEAIKRYREATGLGLAESKAAVDALEQRQGPAPSSAVKTSSGCLGMLFLGIGLIATSALWV